MNPRLIAAILCLGLCSARLADAHPAPFSYLDIRMGDPIEVSLTVHVLDVAHELKIPESALLDAQSLASHRDAIVALLEPRLRLIADNAPLSVAVWGAPEIVTDRHALRLTVRYPSPPSPGRLAIDAWMFPYDPVHQTFVNVYERDALMLQAILTADRQRADYFAGTRQGTLAVVRRFLASGVHHILIGPDHLLFLIGLLLLGGTLRRLVLIVSAFTVAHSVTLSLAALAIVSPPAWIVEPAIALSIVYVGADNLTVRGGRDMRAWIAFAFGFIHGFGFASVLREMDLPPRALGWSLFSFNLGVELGQVAVVLVVASALAAIRGRSETAARRLTVAGSLVVIAAGTFWFIERVFFAG
jgi:hydrogenase/urease accessory protein HupE